MSNINLSFFGYQSKRVHTALLPNEQQQAFGTTRKSMNYTALLQDPVLPLLPVPQKLWFTWIESRITFAPELTLFPGVLPYTRDPIMVPIVDDIGTAFIKEEMPIQYTIWNMLFISERSGTKTQTQETTSFSLSYALDVLKAINKESAGEVTAQYQQQFQTTITFFLENSKALWQLEEKSTRNNEDYRLKVAETEYDDNTPGTPPKTGFLSGLRNENQPRRNPEKKMLKIGDKKAESFMRQINDAITLRLKNHFDGLANQMPKREIRVS